MNKLKLSFDSKDQNSTSISLDVRKPTSVERNTANMKRARAWHEAVESKVIMRDKLDFLLRDDSVWGETRQNKFTTLKKTIRENEIKLLSEKGSGLTKVDLKVLAIATIKLRNELISLSTQRNSIDNNTAESIANQTEFNYLISFCTVYNSGVYAGKPYFTSYDNFVERQNEQVAIDASNKLYELLYEDAPEEKIVEEDSTEIKFLKKYHFIDESGRLINKEGKLIDESGRLINEDGRYIDTNGDFIDFDGNKVDEKGNFVVTEVPFDENDD